MTRFLLLVSWGALLGGFIFAWFSPQLITWYFTTPADLAFSCREAVVWGVETFRKVMFTGGIMGGIVSGITYFAIRRWRKNRLAAKIAAAASVQTPTALK